MQAEKPIALTATEVAQRRALAETEPAAGTTRSQRAKRRSNHACYIPFGLPVDLRVEQQAW